MKFFILCVIFVALSILSCFLGSPKWHIKLTGGFCILGVIFIILGYIKAGELLKTYMEK